MYFILVNRNIFELPGYEVETMNGYDNNRPYLLIKRLEYKNIKYSFAVPLRSNIPINKLEYWEYFVLPPRENTLNGCVHGLQYSKMLILPSYYQNKFNFPNETYEDLFKYILHHRNQIINGAQRYLTKYSKGFKPDFSTSIDEMINSINNSKLNNKKLNYDFGIDSNTKLEVSD